LKNFPKLRKLELRGWFNDYNFLQDLAGITNLDVGYHTVKKEHLEWLPNLRKYSFGMRTDLPPWIEKLHLIECDFGARKWNLRKFSEQLPTLRSITLESPVKNISDFSLLTNLTKLKVGNHASICWETVSELTNLKSFQFLPPTEQDGLEEWCQYQMNK
jgi:hypothetical protein